jgi:hypothetical protein
MNLGTTRALSGKPKKDLDYKVIRKGKGTYPTKIYNYKKNLVNRSKSYLKSNKSKRYLFG